VINATTNEINCLVAKDTSSPDYGKLPYILNSINQENGYISGTGIFY
jgi:hypothetical protein